MESSRSPRAFSLGFLFLVCVLPLAGCRASATTFVYFSQNSTAERTVNRVLADGGTRQILHNGTNPSGVALICLLERSIGRMTARTASTFIRGLGDDFVEKLFPHGHHKCADWRSGQLEEEARLERIREELVEEIERVRRERVEWKRRKLLELEFEEQQAP